jgi:hypothetical protein
MAKRMLIWLGFGVLSFVFFISMGIPALAQQAEEGMCIVPTGPGQALNDLGSSIKIYGSSDTISSTTPVNLNIAPGSWGKPPYRWQVSGTGYSLDKDTTKSDPETVILTSGGGT